MISKFINYFTMSTAGNASDFGDLTVARAMMPGLANPTRGIFAGGFAPGEQNVIDFVTIASTGNATDFGDMFDVALNDADIKTIEHPDYIKKTVPQPRKSK